MSYRSLALAVAAFSSMHVASADAQSVYVAPGGVYVGGGPVYVIPAPNNGAPPSYGATRQALTGRVWVVPAGAAAARGAMRSAARGRRGRRAQGLASGNCCNSQHHLISGRTTRSAAHIPHACGEEATRMRPIYDDGYCLAQGWHGHHPSRADRVAMRRGAPVVSVSRYTC